MVRYGHATRPNTRVIPERWARHQMPTIAGTQTGTCEIRRPGGIGTTFDPGTGTTTSMPYPPHYTGGCRIQVDDSRGRQAMAAGQEVTTMPYLVTVDRDTSQQTQAGDIVTVTAVDDNGDPALVGQELYVQAGATGTLAWERDLACILNL